MSITIPPWAHVRTLLSPKNWWRKLPWVALALSLTLIMQIRVGGIPEHLPEGSVAPYDIRADRPYNFEDEAATEQARDKVAEQVRKIYDYDLDLSASVRDKIHAVFKIGRDMMHDDDAAARARIRTLLAAPLPEAAWKMLRDESWSSNLEESIVREVQELLKNPVVENLDALRAERERGVVIRKISSQNGATKVDEQIVNGLALDDIPSLEQIRTRLYVHTYRQYRVAIKEWIGALLPATCQPNVEATKAAQTAARESVPSVVASIKAGELIARQYERISPQQVKVLQHIRAQKTEGNRFVEMIGTFGFLLLVLVILHGVGTRFLRAYRPSPRDLGFFATVLIMITLMMRLGSIISDALARGLQSSIPPEGFIYLIPVAMGGMMVRFLRNLESALLMSIAFGCIAGVIMPHDAMFGLYTTLASIIGASAMGHADRRSLIIRAGLVAGGWTALCVLTIHAMHASNLHEILFFGDIAWYAILTMSGTVLAAIGVLALTPVMETLFHYTSDIKLLELANLNHPLLRELVIRAPGTYHHSHLVGILAEAAATAIDANPLLARVSAYYHDVGKMKKPNYYIENHKGPSPHERLTPHMSAMIIASHVKEGIELARQYKLPQPIIDMIPQHHGTKMISFFFERAKAEADPALEEIREEDFRYPGPKPQTPEAGILLLADGTEGAVRALSEKTPARIQQTVDGIINKSFAEGQLDECEMTLKDLHLIAAAFARILIGIYHQRIEYPREVLQLHNRDVAVVEGGRGT